MTQWLVNNYIVIDAPDLASAYELADAMGIVIESIEEH